MQRETFESERGYQDYLKKGRDYFLNRYSLGACYNSARANSPMLLHLHEQGERTNALLERIVELLKRSGSVSDEQNDVLS